MPAGGEAFWRDRAPDFLARSGRRAKTYPGVLAFLITVKSGQSHATILLEKSVPCSTNQIESIQIQHLFGEIVHHFESPLGSARVVA